MNIFYLFLLACEDNNANTVPQDLAVSVTENTQIFMTSEKNAVNSCWTADFWLLPPFHIAAARDFFLCLEISCISAQGVSTSYNKHKSPSIKYQGTNASPQMCTQHYVFERQICLVAWQQYRKTFCRTCCFHTACRVYFKASWKESKFQQLS